MCIKLCTSVSLGLAKATCYAQCNVATLREVNCLMLCNEEHALSTHPRQLTNHTSGFGSTGKVKTHAPKALYLMLAAALDAIYCGCCEGIDVERSEPR